MWLPLIGHICVRTHAEDSEIGEPVPVCLVIAETTYPICVTCSAISILGLSSRQLFHSGIASRVQSGQLYVSPSRLERATPTSVWYSNSCGTSHRLLAPLRIFLATAPQVSGNPRFETYIQLLHSSRV